MRAGIGAGGILRSVARRIRSQFTHTVLILLYHRIEEAAADPWALSVTPHHFAEQLEVLRRHAHPIPLHDVPGVLRTGRLPRRAVVVTFDDGYADNLHHAKPLLERQGVPATVFLTSGFIGGENEFWWDTLERLLLSPGTLPETLALPLNGDFRWELGDAAHYEEQAALRHRCWRAWETPPTGRHALYLALWERLQPWPAIEQQRALAALHSWAGSRSRTTPGPARPALARSDVTALVTGGLLDVGAHTVTHPALSALPMAVQREEILGSKACLEDLLERPVTSFTYPYGRRCDYSMETVALVREAEFACACSNFAGSAGASSDPFQLPRLAVQDWGGEEFTRWLLGHFAG